MPCAAAGVEALRAPGHRPAQARKKAEAELAEADAACVAARAALASAQASRIERAQALAKVRREIHALRQALPGTEEAQDAAWEPAPPPAAPTPRAATPPQPFPGFVPGVVQEDGLPGDAAADVFAMDTDGEDDLDYQELAAKLEAASSVRGRPGDPVTIQVPSSDSERSRSPLASPRLPPAAAAAPSSAATPFRGRGGRAKTD